MISLLLISCSSPEPEAPRAPDLVLVVVDTLRVDRLGIYGYERATTPNLDRAAAEGLVFERAYSHSGWTLPSFASLYSGLLPHQHQVMRATQNEYEFGWLQPEAVTIAELLNEQGYRTASFTTNTFLDAQFGLSQGFDLYDNAWDRDAYETTATALEWLNGSDQPSFMVVHWLEPHLSYKPELKFRGTFASKTDTPILVPFEDHATIAPWKKGESPDTETQQFVQALYDEEILTVDAAFRALTEGLADQWDQTRLVFTSDHGEEHWDHGAFEHGHTLYSELTHVPLIVMGAGIEPGRSDTLVGHQDLYTSLVTWGGATHTRGYGGLDLLSLAASELPGRSILSESTLYGGEKVSLVKKTHRLVVDQRKSRYDLLCMDRDSLIEHACVVQDSDWAALREHMYQETFALRGDLNTVVHTTELRRSLDRKTTDELKALGYLE